MSPGNPATRWLGDPVAIGEGREAVVEVVVVVEEVGNYVLASDPMAGAGVEDVWDEDADPTSDGFGDGHGKGTTSMKMNIPVNCLEGILSPRLDE